MKVSFATVAHGGRARYLGARFSISENRIQNDPRLWYFLAFYDARQLRLHDPAFLVPSHVFHKAGRAGKKKGKIYFLFVASLAPDSRDRWSPYRVAPIDLGKRLLAIVDGVPLMASGRRLPLPANGVWLARAKRGRASASRSSAPNPAYALIRRAVLERSSLMATYRGHRRIFSPYLLGTKHGDPHVLGYQFGGTSEEPLGPDGSRKNWRCLRVAELTRLKLLPGTWHVVQKGHGFQNCIDQVDVRAYAGSAVKHPLRRAA